MAPFAIRFVESHPFGQLAAIELPEGLEPPPPAVLARLAPEEAAFAAGLRGRRAIEWTGGRLALRAAAAAAGIDLPAVLPGEGGQPALPAGLRGSLTHKRRLAIALLGEGPATLGIDLEELARPRLAIAGRVLRPEELAALESLPEAARWPDLVRRFACKEAIYKALYPHVRRYVAFSEASVSLHPLGVRLHLAGGEGPFALELDLRERDDHLLALVRLRAAIP